MSKIKYVTSQDCKDILNGLNDVYETHIIYGKPGEYSEKVLTFDTKTYTIINNKVEQMPPDYLIDNK